ncbi:HEAT repeat domain-containing protein [Ferruginibacter albus]|uniref:HEAT repeat domain-containing protein n=1 Tax=Ferruginibacter albus TaxID=2875540 RepID=UPI001CC7A33A|nr:hypothetical protein [Ferruginibacter albus]UAY52087.1 hypothetical protein K9M53_16040 [Ferruginibacter albus]
MELIDTIDENDRSYDNVGVIHELQQFIERSTDIKKIRKAYLILGNIGRNKTLPELTNYFIQKVIVESNTDIKGYIYIAIAWQKKTVDVNIKPLFDLLKKYSQGKIVDPIINCLGNSENPDAEDALIYILENYKSDWSIIQANATLHTAGTRKCIPYLEKKLNEKSQDLAGSAFLALIRHADKRESNLFIGQLLNGKDRHSAMEGIFMHSGIEAVPAVIERIKKKTASKRATDGNCYFYPTENDITLGLKFLNRYKQESIDIQQLFDFLLTKRRDKLFEDELKTLEEIVK